MYDHTFLNLQITWSDIRPQIKWSITQIITYGHFNLPLQLVWVCLGQHTYFITLYRIVDKMDDAEKDSSHDPVCTDKEKDFKSFCLVVCCSFNPKLWPAYRQSCPSCLHNFKETSFLSLNEGSCDCSLSASRSPSACSTASLAWPSSSSPSTTFGSRCSIFKVTVIMINPELERISLQHNDICLYKIIYKSDFNTLAGYGKVSAWIYLHCNH